MVPYRRGETMEFLGASGCRRSIRADGLRGGGPEVGPTAAVGMGRSVSAYDAIAPNREAVHVDMLRARSVCLPRTRCLATMASSPFFRVKLSVSGKNILEQVSGK